MAGLEEIPICRLCCEPVFFSICPDCLFRDLNLWLEHRAPYVGIEVIVAHELLTNAFPGVEENVQICIRCRRMTHSVLCPYCYIREIYQELLLIDEITAEDLLRDFNFDYEGNGYLQELPWSPIELTHRRTSAGLCEQCDNYSERLYELDGIFLCVACIED